MNIRVRSYTIHFLILIFDSLRSQQLKSFWYFNYFYLTLCFSLLQDMYIKIFYQKVLYVCQQHSYCSKPMAKVVGVSLSLTLAFQLRNWPLGKRGPFHQTWFAERWESSFQRQITSVNLGERRDPDGTYFMVGTRMLEKKQIWSLSDGETNYE